MRTRFLIAFIPRWPLAPEETVIVLASLCCDTGTAEPQLPAGLSADTPQNGLGSCKNAEKWEGNHKCVHFTSALLLLFALCCLPCDCKQSTLGAAQRRDPEDAAFGLVTWQAEQLSLESLTITQSCTSTCTAGNGRCSAALPTLLFLPYAEVKEQQTELPNSTVFA